MLVYDHDWYFQNTFFWYFCSLLEKNLIISINFYKLLRQKIKNELIPSKSNRLSFFKYLWIEVKLLFWKWRKRSQDSYHRIKLGHCYKNKNIVWYYKLVLNQCNNHKNIVAEKPKCSACAHILEINCIRPSHTLKTKMHHLRAKLNNQSLIRLINLWYIRYYSKVMALNL